MAAGIYAIVKKGEGGTVSKTDSLEKAQATFEDLKARKKLKKGIEFKILEECNPEDLDQRLLFWQKTAEVIDSLVKK